MSKHDDDTCPHLVRASLLEAENARLQAEIERLRKAGDQMIITWIDGIDAEGFYWLTEEVQKAWNAAKEGKPSLQ
jgi:hypothetical protein